MQTDLPKSQKKFSGAILIAFALIIVQYILAFFVFKLPGWLPLQWAGWLIWALSLFFGIAPILILRNKGGVAKGNSYIKTTRLVDTSLYAIVRHPQYLGGFLFSLSLALLAQHPLVILLSVVSMLLIYLEIQSADQDGIEKFGAAYRRYMQRVPQMNFLLGIVRFIQSKSIGKG